MGGPRYRADGLAGLVRRERADRAVRRFPAELQLLIEGLALKRSLSAIATIHRAAGSRRCGPDWSMGDVGATDLECTLQVPDLELALA